MLSGAGACRWVCRRRVLRDALAPVGEWIQCVAGGYGAFYFYVCEFRLNPRLPFMSAVFPFLPSLSSSPLFLSSLSFYLLLGPLLTWTWTLIERRRMDLYPLERVPKCEHDAGYYGQYDESGDFCC